MNIALLNQIRARSGDFVPIAELSSDGISHDLEELQAFGFAMEQHPYLGVAYRGPARELCPDQIEHELGTERVGRRIAVWKRVASTNDLAAAASTSIANDGLVILAEEQTSGRGRRGRHWIAPAGSSILMSTLLFPTEPIGDPAWLTALGAVAVAQVLSEFANIQAQIKWPNDVRVEEKKIAGILVERGAGVVVGLGLNVNIASEEMPPIVAETATSMQILTGTFQDRSELVRSLIQRLDRLYMEVLNCGPEPLDRAWRDLLEPSSLDLTAESRKS